MPTQNGVDCSCPFSQLDLMQESEVHHHVSKVQHDTTIDMDGPKCGGIARYHYYSERGVSEERLSKLMMENMG